jgi:hypothetical protein
MRALIAVFKNHLADPLLQIGGRRLLSERRVTIRCRTEKGRAPDAQRGAASDRHAVSLAFATAARNGSLTNKSTL